MVGTVVGSVAIVVGGCVVSGASLDPQLHSTKASRLEIMITSTTLVKRFIAVFIINSPFSPFPVEIRQVTYNILQFTVSVNTPKSGVVSYARGDAMYQRIRDLCEDRDLKQKHLEEYLNCSQQVCSNYELGQQDIPTDVLIRLSRFSQVSTDYLLGLTNNPKQNK